MKHLVKVMLIVASVFAMTFIVGRLMGILSAEQIQYWLEQVQRVDALWVGVLIVLLLFLDLFVAVPTLTVTILAGFFLGFPTGGFVAFVGVSLAAFSGYFLSRWWGAPVLKFLVKKESERGELHAAFQKSGPLMIILSRAAPIVPEVTACMAGVTGMRFDRYLLYFLIGTLPYVSIAAYAGSISSLTHPQPAIFAALLLYGVLWTGWFFFRKFKI